MRVPAVCHRLIVFFCFLLLSPAPVTGDEGRTIPLALADLFNLYGGSQECRPSWSPKGIDQIDPHEFRIGDGETGFKVLWDMGCYDFLFEPSKHFESAINRVSQLGGEVELLKVGQYYTTVFLESFNLVVICGRVNKLAQSEEDALVGYVKMGGGLLVITEHEQHIQTVSSLVGNFGIEFGDSRIVRSFTLTEFEVPATSSRRPVSAVEAIDAYELICKGSAQKITGEPAQAQPAQIDTCLVALGGRTGKGRVVVVSDTNVFRDYRPG